MSRIRTGYESVVADRVGSNVFAAQAKQDGVVTKLDPKLGIMIVKYKDGSEECLRFGSIFTNNSSNGFYVDQEVSPNNFKPGDKFKSGDILIYNTQFFQADPYSKKVNWKIGVLAKVAILDNGGTIEDASILTKPLCEKMVFNPVHVKDIVITRDTNVHSFATVGTEVTNSDPLIVFDQSAVDFGDDDDPELTRLLSDLNKAAPKAEHTGTVVEIEALYKAPISTMSTGLQKLVKHVIQNKNARAAEAANCSNAIDFKKSVPLEATDRVGITELTEDTVILRFYIRQTKSMNPGDKLFFDSSLKSVCSTVYPDYIMSEDGIKVEACTSARGILARLITSPFLTGIGNSVLEKLENDILEDWFDTK